MSTYQTAQNVFLFFVLIEETRAQVNNDDTKTRYQY